MKKLCMIFVCLLVVCFQFAACTKQDDKIQKEEKPENPDAAIACVDFIVEVESGRDPVILQLTDTQIIDSSQMRDPSRLGGEAIATWAKNRLEYNCFKYLREVIQEVKPDVIIMTGDQVYGEFDDSGTSLVALVNFMESMGVPWAPVLGNHDAETKKGVDWVCNQYENAKHCFFKQRELTGNGNYTVGIKQDGKLKRVFFMLDTNGCLGISEESTVNGHTLPSGAKAGLRQDQIDWYTQTAEQIKGYCPSTKLSVAFHVQPTGFRSIFPKYGFKTGYAPLNLDEMSMTKDGDFGLIQEELKNAWSNSEFWDGLETLGVDSVFVGHTHLNNASVVLNNGIRCQFGTKSSTYDRYNAKSLGGTVIPLSHEDGTIKSPYAYIVEN